MTSDRRNGLIGNAAIKVPCVAATTAAITLSGNQTIDGIACVTGDRVLVKNQASGIDNGIYIVDTGAWTRAPDFDGTYDAVEGTLVLVTSGAIGGDLVYQQTTASPVIGTSSLAFTIAFSSAAVSSYIMTLLDDATAADARTTLGALGTSGGNMTGGINEARGSIAMHATTMDLWAQPNIIDGTSSAVTITAIANAPQAGARRTLYPVAGSIITNGATFAVDGAANATAAAGDKWEFEAITTSTYKVHITKKDGTPVVSSSGSGQLLKYTKITATDAAWAKQAGTNRIVVCCKGGGGAGGGNNTAHSATAEGGFAGCTVWGESSTLTATFVATIGAGGTGVSGASGNSGGTTSFTTSTPTTIASAPGGAGGQYSTVARVYAGQLGMAGQTGEAVGGVGTNAAAGGAAAANSAAGGGGCSGASGSNLTGGAGGSGVIHVWEYS